MTKIEWCTIHVTFIRKSKMFYHVFLYFLSKKNPTVFMIITKPFTTRNIAGVLNANKVKGIVKNKISSGMDFSNSWAFYFTT